MDVFSSPLRRVHTMAKKVLSLVPAAGTKCHEQPDCLGAGDIEKVTLLAVITDI